jgi:hypothetical protein
MEMDISKGIGLTSKNWWQIEFVCSFWVWQALCGPLRIVCFVKDSNLT